MLRQNEETPTLRLLASLQTADGAVAPCCQAATWESERYTGLRCFESRNRRLHPAPRQAA